MYNRIALIGNLLFLFVWIAVTFAFLSNLQLAAWENMSPPERLSSHCLSCSKRSGVSRDLCQPMLITHSTTLFIHYSDGQSAPANQQIQKNMCIG